MTPEKIRTDAFRVVGPGGEFSHENMSGIPALWEEFARRAGEIPNPDSESGPAAFGAMFGAPDNFLYVAGVSSRGGAIPEGMRELEVPAGNYARFAFQAKGGGTGFADFIREQFQKINREWLPASGLKMRWPAPVMERYGERFDPKAMTGEVEIWMPVE